MKMVLIDTANKARVVLGENGEVLVKKEWESGKNLGGELLEKLDEGLNEMGWGLKDIERVAVNKGPGGYSSLRAGVVTGVMLAEALNCDLVSVIGDNIDDQMKRAVEGKTVEIVETVYN